MSHPQVDAGQPSTDPYALVVEDDALIQMHATEILRDGGFRTYEVDTADDAVPLLAERADQIILLFTDVEMPGEMDGFGLARHVAERWPHIEIVVASGRVKPQSGDMPAKATFIGKPFSQHVVLDHLREKLPDGKKPEPLKTAS